MIKYRDIQNGGNNELDLSVSISGTEISVSSGEFSLDGTSYELDDDVVVDFGVNEAQRQIQGWLVRVIDTDEITILWDECFPGDLPFVFEFNGPYRLLARLLTGIVPANAADWTAEDVQFVVNRIQPIGD